jgi:release factor glutamine methyltransferase
MTAPAGAPPPQSPGGADAPWTIARLLQWTQTRFAAEGLDSPRADAEHLLAHALGCDRMRLYVEHDKVVNEEERAAFRDLVRRRLQREPVAYIEGRRGFHALDLELRVDRRVLVPRPETELLVDWVLEELRPPPAPPMHVLDVGTGSGAIALALARARPDLHVVACDVSEEALAVATDNARRLELSIELHRSDLLADVPRPEGGWAAIVANLPYVERDVWATLAPEVRDHEPRLALDGGPDGLDVIRRLAGQAAEPGVLAPHGGLYLEIGWNQGEATRRLLEAAGFHDVAVRSDLAGDPRIVRGFRSRAD